MCVVNMKCVKDSTCHIEVSSSEKSSKDAQRCPRDPQKSLLDLLGSVDQ